MKTASSLKLYLLMLTLSTFSVLTSCQKNDATPEPSTALIGRWKLLQTSGGLAGGTWPADPKQKQELILNNDGRAQFLLNGTVVRTTTYTVLEAKSLLTQQTQKMLYFGAANDSTRLLIEELTATNLSLSEDAFDGMGQRYARVKTGAGI